MATIRIYDNGGRTIDRYTAVFINRVHKRLYNGFGKPLIIEYEALGFSANPYHGIGMHITAMRGRHLGKVIKLEDLPTQAQQFVKENM